MNGTLYVGDCIEQMKHIPSGTVQTCVTSPPYYGLRDYGHEGQIGQEKTPEEYITRMVEVFREVKRVLRDDGTLWVNIGDSYAGPKGNTRGEGAGGGKERGELMGFDHIGKNRVPDGFKPKDLIGIPWMLAFALRADGWYLRQDIIWHKPNPMPESVTDRCTKSHEHIFLLSKSPRYYFDINAIKEPASVQGISKYEGTGDKNAILIGQGLSQTRFVGERKPHKNTEYDGQPVNTFHESRANGEKDKEYIVRNKRDVWTVSTQACSEAHFATFPEALIEPCILAGCPKGGIVLDPFIGSGTTGMVCERLKRRWVGSELNPDYAKMAERRIDEVAESLTVRQLCFEGAE